MLCTCTKDLTLTPYSDIRAELSPYVACMGNFWQTSILLMLRVWAISSTTAMLSAQCWLHFFLAPTCDSVR
uniref:Uncharacterized protein n=1 Tax=Arundo donax TaxID=35708 RepID=A0A0A9HA66_ARUDO